MLSWMDIKVIHFLWSCIQAKREFSDKKVSFKSPSFGKKDKLLQTLGKEVQKLNDLKPRRQRRGYRPLEQHDFKIELRHTMIQTLKKRDVIKTCLQNTKLVSLNDEMEGTSRPGVKERLKTWTFRMMKTILFHYLSFPSSQLLPDEITLLSALSNIVIFFMICSKQVISFHSFVHAPHELSRHLYRHRECKMAM
jgi:hypothetical protein